jgi:gamma-glutamyltranspeptidase/glutathione hydrolase
MNVQAAIEAPRWVHGRGMPGDPPGVIMESRFPAATVARLRSLGHAITPVEPYTGATGHAQGIVIDQATGLLHGGADPRCDSAAVGW